MILSLLAFTILATAGLAPVAFAQVAAPTGCTNNGIGISITESEAFAFVGDAITYTVTPALATQNDCNILNATITLTTPDGVLHTVSTGASITRATTAQAISTATCAGTPNPTSGCQWVVTGAYTTSAANAQSNPAECASVGLTDPCDLHASANIAGTSQTAPFTQAASATNGISAVLVSPGITVTKSVPPKVEVGSTVTVMAHVTNTGNIALMVTVVDTIAGPLNCGSGTGVPVALAAGASVDCSGTYIASTGGTITNVVTAVGTYAIEGGPSGTVSASDTKSTTVIQAGLTLTKTPSSTKVVGGALVTYTYHVCNTGNVALVVSISDNVLGVIATPFTLAAGACQDFTKASSISATTTNIATATAVDQFDHQVTAQAVAHVQVIHPSISITKTPSAVKVEGGSSVTYTYHVCNTGDTSLTVGVTDNVYGSIASGVSLAATACQDFTKTSTLTSTVTNTATATGVDQLKDQVQATASATVTVIHPSLTSSVSCTPPTRTVQGQQSGSITWTVIFTNTGDVPLAIGPVLDTLGHVFVPATFTLNPTQSQTFTFVDTNLGVSTYTDAATATGTDQLQQHVTATSNTASCQIIIQEVLARWTGGGRFNVPFILTHGFELHCNPQKNPNNLQVNWIMNGKEYHFHMTKENTANCFYDPNLGSPNPPRADVNTIVGTGTGRLNGKTGYSIQFKFTDQGQPASGLDPSTIIITDPSNNVVLSMVDTVLMHGAQQAHRCTGNSC